MNEPVPQRISDADRDQAADCLREHLAQGRLAQDEFEERLNTALAAKTASDLAALFSDLPEPRPTALKSPEPMSSPWPAYPSPPRASLTDNVPAQRPEPQQPVLSSNWSNALMVAAAVAWPAWLVASFATGWRVWWLIFIPIAISAVAGKFRSQTGQ